YRESHGHEQGPRFPGRGEALELPWRAEHARQPEAPASRLDRARYRSVARDQGQEDARPFRRRAVHADPSPRGEDRRGAQPDLHPRLGSRSQERDRARPQAGLTAWLTPTTPPTTPPRRSARRALRASAWRFP